MSMQPLHSSSTLSPSATLPEKKAPASYTEYFDPAFPLLDRLEVAYREEKVSARDRRRIEAILAPLREKHYPTYEHCIRVGLVAREIGRFLQLDTNALFRAGVLHDAGKALCPVEILEKTSGWTKEDSRIMKRHVTDGCRLIRGIFEFSAAVMLWHHRFQPHGYPVKLPKSNIPFSLGTKTKIAQYGRILALADTFDALHRINDRNGSLHAPSGMEVKAQMFEYNKDEKALLERLFRNRILKTYIHGAPNAEAAALDAADAWYDSSFLETDRTRTPRNTRRHVELACALEPLSDKAGCTTRHSDVSRHLSLPYFIVAGINLGDAFEELGKRVSAGAESGLYECALRAQAESKRNRRGGRVNQGIIELLVPIVTAQHQSDPQYCASPETVLERARDFTSRTARADVEKLIEMKRLAHTLSHYDRSVPDHPEAADVLQYYKLDLAASGKPTSIAHNSEFVNGFPTVRMMREVLHGCPYPHFQERVEEAYQRAVRMHDPGVSPGFLADCIAAAIYLELSQYPTARLIG